MIIWRLTGSIKVQGIYVEAGGWESCFVVCFYRLKKSEDNGADKSAKSTDKLNLSQKKIVEFILENGKVTNKDVQRLLGVKDSRALKILRFIRLLIYVYIQHRLMVATICSMCYHLELCERL